MKRPSNIIISLASIQAWGNAAQSPAGQEHYSHLIRALWCADPAAHSCDDDGDENPDGCPARHACVWELDDGARFSDSQALVELVPP